MKIHSYLQETLNYTNFQIRVLKYFFQTIFAEISKFLIMCIYFSLCGNLHEYIFGVLVLSFLRLSSGGLHRKTYWGCFLYSFLYLFACIQILPRINLLGHIQTILLILAVFIGWRVGSVPSPLKRHVTSKQRQRCHLFFVIGLSCYIFFSITFFRDSIYRNIGFWIIVIHIIQLIIAKNRGGDIDEEKKNQQSSG